MENFINLYKEHIILAEDLGKVNIVEAQTVDKTISAKSLYEKSGLLIYNRTIEKYFNKFNLKAVFFESSPFATTLKNETLVTFTGVWIKDQTFFEFPDKAACFYKIINKTLQENNASIFWHREFFICPQEARCYISKVKKSSIGMESQEYYNNKKTFLSDERNKLIEEPKLEEIINKINPFLEEFEKIYVDEHEKNSNDYSTARLNTINRFKGKLSKNNLLSEMQRNRLNFFRIVDENNSNKESQTFVNNSEFLMDFEKVVYEKSEIVTQSTDVFTLHLVNHRVYHNYFCPNPDNTVSIFISIPILGNPSLHNLTNKGFHGQGAVFFLLIFNEDPLNVNGSFDKAIKDFCNEISFDAKEIIFNYLLQSGFYLFDKARENSIKAAKAAIMSRNMSHNIGSHVLSYLKAKLSSVEEIFKNDEVLQELINNLRSSNIAIHGADIHKYIEKTKYSLELPFLIGLGRFINYLQERQDFIATIATDFIPYLSTVNFKDFIFDELNNDLKIIRHSLAGDNLMKKYISKNIVLDYIARSEGYNRESIKIKYENFDGLNDKICHIGEINEDAYNQPIDGIPKKYVTFLMDTNKYQLKEYKSPTGALSYHVQSDAIPNEKIDVIVFGKTVYKVISKTIDGYGAKDLSHLRELFVDLPGGIIGRQAFFSIMENIVRNSAKHSKNIPRRNNDLEFTIRLLDCNFGDQSYLKVSVTDNTGNASPETVKKLNEYILSPLVDTKGNIIDEHKGLKEMRISAAWLRNQHLDDEDIFFNGLRKFPRFIEVDSDEHLIDKENNYETIKTGSNLSFYFYLLKPQNLAFISTRSQFEVNEINSKLPINSGWKVFTFESYKNHFAKNFRITLIENIFSTEDKNSLKNIVSTRALFFSENIKSADQETIPILWQDYFQNTDNKTNIFYLTCYKKWVTNAYGFITENLIFIGDSGITDNFYQDHLDEKENLKQQIIYDISEQSLISPNKLSDSAYINKLARISIFFIRHYQTNSDFKGFQNIKNRIIELVNSKPGKNRNTAGKHELKFIEGITGNNSTDRLIRHEKINKEWTYRIIESSLSDILIIDERIWDHLVQKYNGNDILDIKNYTLQNDRRISVFNIKLQYDNEIPKEFSIINLKNEVVGTISCEKSDLDPILKFDIKVNFIHHEYHFVLIHQGILDKLYDFFLKTKEDMQKVNDLFKQLTKIFKVNKYGRYIIHSGRSKPYNMPANTAFVNYSSLENAFYDCKLSLSELLHATRYE
jgi:hypothetical protein